MLQRTDARVRSGELSLDGIMPILPMADLSLNCRELLKESCSRGLERPDWLAP